MDDIIALRGVGALHQFGETAQRSSHRVHFPFKVVAELLRRVERFEEVSFAGAGLLPLLVVLEEDSIVVDVVHERLSLVHERGHPKIKVVASDKAAHCASARGNVAGNLAEVAQDLSAIGVENASGLVETVGKRCVFVEQLILVETRADKSHIVIEEIDRLPHGRDQFFSSDKAKKPIDLTHRPIKGLDRRGERLLILVKPSVEFTDSSFKAVGHLSDLAKCVLESVSGVGIDHLRRDDLSHFVLGRELRNNSNGPLSHKSIRFDGDFVGVVNSGARIDLESELIEINPARLVSLIARIRELSDMDDFPYRLARKGDSRPN